MCPPFVALHLPTIQLAQVRLDARSDPSTSNRHFVRTHRAKVTPRGAGRELNASKFCTAGNAIASP